MMTTVELTVRPMARGDLAAVLEVERAAYPRPPWSEALFEEELERTDRRYLVGVDAGEVVAFVGARVAGGDAEILTLAVTPDRQERGIGRALVAALLEVLEAEGAESVTLEVRTGNPAAQNLYRALGFVTVGNRPGYYQDGEDALVMWKAPSGRKG